MIELVVFLQTVTPAHVQNVQREVPAIRRHLDEQLIDYPSARFRDVFVSANPQAEAEGGTVGGYLCGFINSKNRMGGYTGWKRFLASEIGVYVEGDTMGDILVPAACGSNSVSQQIDRSDWVQYR